MGSKGIPQKNSHPRDDTTVSTIPYVDHRTAPRYVFKVPAKVILPYNEGPGMLWDISSSGARVEKSQLAPLEGERVRLEFSFFKDSPPVQLTGDVVRHTDTGGFCIQFASLTPRMRQILCRLLPKVASARMKEDQVSGFSGQVRTNVGPELHEACVAAASAAGLELEDWMKRVLDQASKNELDQLDQDPERAMAKHLADPQHDPSTCLDCRRKAAR